MKRFLDNVKIINQNLTWQKVKSDFMKQNDVMAGSNIYAAGQIKNANEKYLKWIHIQMGFEVAGEIILPSHPSGQHGRSKIKLIPDDGLSVYNAYLNLKENETKYQEEIPDCLKIIRSYNNQPLGIIYLVEKKFPTNECLESKLFHLDGLHRLLSVFYPVIRKNILVDCYVAYEAR